MVEEVTIQYLIVGRGTEGGPGGYYNEIPPDRFRPRQPQYEQNPFKSPQMIPPHRGSNQGYYRDNHRMYEKDKMAEFFTPTMNPRPLKKPPLQKYMEYKIVKIEGLNSYVNPKMLFNIFSQYGFIFMVKLAFRDEDCFAYIQFCEHSECLVVRDFMDNISLFKSVMRVNLTKFDTIEEIEFFERSDKVSYSLNLKIY